MAKPAACGPWSQVSLHPGVPAATTCDSSFVELLSCVPPQAHRAQGHTGRHGVSTGAAEVSQEPVEGGLQFSTQSTRPVRLKQVEVCSQVLAPKTPFPKVIKDPGSQDPHTHAVWGLGAKTKTEGGGRREHARQRAPQENLQQSPK